MKTHILICLAAVGLLMQAIGSCTELDPGKPIPPAVMNTPLPRLTSPTGLPPAATASHGAPLSAPPTAPPPTVTHPVSLPTATATLDAAPAPPTGVTREEAGQSIPLAPAAVAARVVTGKARVVVEVQWSGTGESLTAYQIYRQRVGANNWTLLAAVPAVGNNLGGYTYQDSTVLAGSTYRYGVAARNGYGKNSEITPSNTVAVPSY